MALDRTRWPELLLGLERVRVLEVARDGEGRLHVAIETTDELTACGGYGVRATVKDRAPVEFADLPAFGAPVLLVWVKRRWSCREPACGAQTWTEQRPDIGPGPSSGLLRAYVRRAGVDVIRGEPGTGGLREPRRRPGSGDEEVTPEILISERPAEATDRAIPGHWKATSSSPGVRPNSGVAGDLDQAYRLHDAEARMRDGRQGVTNCLPFPPCSGPRDPQRPSGAQAGDKLPAQRTADPRWLVPRVG